MTEKPTLDETLAALLTSGVTIYADIQHALRQAVVSGEGHLFGR
jgi:hypothetical protein